MFLSSFLYFIVRVRCRGKKFTFAISSADEFLFTVVPIFKLEVWFCVKLKGEVWFCPNITMFSSSLRLGIFEEISSRRSMVEIFKEKYGCIPYFKEICGVILDAHIQYDVCLSCLLFIYCAFFDTHCIIYSRPI